MVLVGGSSHDAEVQEVVVRPVSFGFASFKVAAGRVIPIAGENFDSVSTVGAMACTIESSPRGQKKLLR